MKINLFISDKLPTARTSETQSGGMGKRSPINVPLMDDTAQAISAAGRVASDISQRMYVAEGQRETLEAYNKMNEGFNITLDELKKPAYQDLSVSEHEKWFKDKTTTIKSNILGGMKNFKARQAMTQKFDIDASNEMVKAQTIGWNREVDKGRSTLYKSLDLYSNEAAKGNFKAIGDAEAAVKGSVSAGYITKEQGEKVLDEFNNTTTATYWKRQSDDFQETTFDTTFIKSRDNKGFPVRGKEGLWKVRTKLPESFGNLDEEQKRQTLEYIKKGWEDYYSRWSWGNRKAKILIGDDMKNDLARIQETGAGDINIKQKLFDAYSDDVEEAKQRWELHQRNQALASTTYKYTDQILKASPEEQAEIMERLDAQGEKADPFIKDLTDWRRAALINDLETVAYKKQQALANDPYAFVDAFINPEEKRLMPTLDRVRANMLDQERFGVAPLNRSTMSTTAAKYLVVEFGSLTGEQIVNKVDQMKAEYGEFFAAALKDLQKEKLPDEIQVIASLDPTRDAVLRHQIAEASKTKEADLKAAIGEDGNIDAKDINTKLDDAMGIFYNTVLRGNPSAARVEQLNNIRTALRKSILMEVAKGTKLKDATQKAVDAFITTKYDEISVNGFDSLIPKGIPTTPNIVENNLSTIQRNIGNRSIVLPNKPDYLTDEVHKNRVISDLRSRGFWALNRDMSGMIFYAGYDSLPVMEMVDGEEQRIEILFKDMNKKVPNKMSIDALDYLEMGGF